MTPEHGSKSEEICSLRAAKAGRSSNICLSPPNASVLHKLQTQLAATSSQAAAEPGLLHTPLHGGTTLAE